MTLDARQRAMLAEMGVRVWQPEPVAHVAEPSEQAPAEAPAVTVTVRDASETIAGGDRQQPGAVPGRQGAGVRQCEVAGHAVDLPAQPIQRVHRKQGLERGDERNRHGGLEER